MVYVLRITQQETLERDCSKNVAWSFTVDNNYSSKSTIYWSLQSSHNSNLYLLDTESGDIVNMSKESSYYFTD